MTNEEFHAVLAELVGKEVAQYHRNDSVSALADTWKPHRAERRPWVAPPRATR